MATFSAGGKAHAILTHLSKAPDDLAGIRAALPPRVARKAWHVLAGVLAGDLIQRIGAIYYITEAGKDALAVLDAGHDFAVAGPSVRVFGRAA